MSEKQPYYADGYLVRKRAQSRPIPGGQTISIGFPVCRATDYVGDEGAATIAALLCLGEAAQVTFQARVQPWIMACFGPEVSGDREERNHRFLEEALELVQACGCTASEAHQLVDYTFARDVGEPLQETGGVMVTLAALCLANGLDMHEAAEVELARIWTKVEKIRAKQAAKPKHSPLPEPAAAEIALIVELTRKVARLNDALKPFAEACNKADALAAERARAAGVDGIPDEYLAFVSTSYEGALDGSAWPLFKFGDLRHAAQLTRADAGEVGRDG